MAFTASIADISTIRLSLKSITTSSGSSLGLNFSEKALSEIMKKIPKSYYISELFKNRKEKFSDDFIRKNKNYIDFSRAEIYKHMSLELIAEMKDYVKWSYISRHKEFSKDFFIQHLDKLDLEVVFKNKKLKFLEADVKFVEKDIELLLKLNGYVLVPVIRKT